MTTPHRTSARIVVIGALATCVIACAPDATEIPDPIRRLYVLSSIRMEASDGTRASGLDLDGLDSSGEGATCVDRHADLQSVRDPAEHGVDNAMAVQVPNFQRLLGDECAPGTEDCLADILARGIASGELLVVVEVRDIHSFVNDDVEVVLHRATSAGAPLLIDGALAPDQTFALEPLATAAHASIEAGTLRASFDAPFPIDLPLGEVTWTLPVRTARLEASIDLADLRDGVLAGGLDVDEVVRTTMCDPTACDPGLLDSFADLSPRPGDPTRCAEVSFALDVGAVSAAEP